MKNLLPVSVLSCVLLAGCGAPAATEPTDSSSATTASEQVTSDTEAETCEQLYTGDSDAPFPVSVSLMGAIFTEGPVEPIPADQQSEIEYAHALMTGIASTANEDMKDLVERANRPFTNLMFNGYDTGGVSVEDYKEAASELLKRCPPPDDLVFEAPTTAASPTPTPTPTPTATPEPKPEPDPVEKVTYVVESDGTIDFITYTHFIDGSTAQEQASGPLYGKVQKTYTFKSADMYKSYSFWSLGVSGSAGPDASKITCKIILNGKVISEQTSTGAYAHVMCNKGDSNM